MSAFRRKFGPRRAAVTAVGVFAFLGANAVGQPTQAAAPTYPDILPLSKVKPGMTGYGLTTFKGTTISRFEVTIVGIMRKANNGHDLILIRMKGGPITERGANLIHGMSGSPIYINDKCIGAFSMGEPWPKEPVGMVTPIEDMLEAWDPNIPQTPPYFQPAEKQPTNPSPTDKSGPDARQDGKKKPETGKTTQNNWLFPTPEHLNTRTPWSPDNTERVVHLTQPIQVGSRRITQVVLNARPGTKRASRADVAVMQRATSFAVVGGVGEKERAWFQKELDKRGYAVTLMQTPTVSGKSNLPATTLHPGSVFGTFLATGDVQFGGYGTVTYRKGNRILGFGHPLMGLGALDAAVTSASVLDVFPSIQSSHLEAESGPVIGALTQDRNFSVGGDLNRKPLQIPFDITVHDETTHRNQTFHSLLFRHPDLTAALMSLVGRSAVSNVHNMPGDVMAKVTTTVEAGEVGKITRSNLMFDADDISQPAIQDLTDITNIISGNPFYPLPIKRASMTVELYSGHNTATIERIFLKQGKYEPGDTLEVGVALKPYRRESIFKTISLKIPSDTPSGRYALQVRGGTPSMMRIGSFSMSAGAPDTQTPAVNVRQMLARLNARETNTDMVARLILNTAAPAIEGEKLSQLPPNLAVLMRSDRNSGVRIERDELRMTAPTDYVVSGAQQLVVTVQRKNTQEVTGPPAFPGAPSGVSPGGTSSLQPGNPSLSNSISSSQDDSEKDSVDTQPTSRPLSLPLNAATQFWQSVLNGPQPELSDFTDEDPPANPLKPPVAQPTPKPAKTPKGKGGQTKPVTPAPPAETTVVPITTDTKPATTPSDTEPVKIVARQLQVWRQTGANGFSAGKFTGTSVTATGELRLAPRLRRLATTNETYIWSLAVDGQGVVYAGTGTGGKILKVDPSGKLTTFAQLPIVSVQSLLLAKDGTLWAGSSVKGQLFHVKQDGTSTLIATLPENYILALCQDSQGNIYAGPGNGGSIYKITPDYTPTDATRTDALKPFVKTGGDFVTAMTVDAKDNLYVGTGSEGIVYKITPAGQSSVLYDAKENSITALTLDKSGNLYAGTGPKGLLYRISPEGTATVVYDRATSFYTGLRLAGDGTLYATTVNAAYHIFPSAAEPTRPTVQPLDNPRDVDFLTLALLPSGGVVMGTGNIGELYTSQPEMAGGAERPSASGTFESVIHDSKLVSQWGTLRWNAMLPSGAHVRVETRTGNVAEPDTTWSDWKSLASISGSEGRIVSPSARFIQYRLMLNGNPGAANGGIEGEQTPAVREVSLSYMPRNQAPRVAFLLPQGGERWAKTQTVRWAGIDPDNDTLSYELFYSKDGVTWQPLPSGSAGAGASGAASATALPTGAVTLQETQKRLDAQKDTPEPIKRLVLESVQRRQAVGLSDTSPSASALRQTSKAWDTRSLPDGTYWLKIVASDIASNPTDPQTAQAISEPFVICNSLPTLTMNSTTIIGPDNRVVLTGTASQALITITAVQYRINGGDWLAAAAKDGLFDSANEGFTLTTLPLPSGKYTIEVAAFNAANGKTSQKVEVTIP